MTSPGTTLIPTPDGGSTTAVLRFPDERPVEVEELLRLLDQPVPGGELTFGDERVFDFLGNLSRALLKPAVTRRHPELASLGSFLRPKRLRRIVAEVPVQAGTLRFPVGRVFHVPPTNVATVLGYSWALAALAGNRNVVRLSPRAPEVTGILLELFAEAAGEAHPAIAATQLLVSYDRDEQLTASLALACDLRVLWGGDATVARLRAHPLRPRARDLTFPDRSSLAVLSVAGWIRSSDEEKQRVVAGLYNDIFWFDQAACSSPRTVVWLGEREPASGCADELVGLLAAEAQRRGFSVDAAMAMHKRVAAYGLALEGAVESLTLADSTLSHVLLRASTGLNERWLGAGAVATLVVDDIEAVARLIGSREQTVTHACLTSQEVWRLAQASGARGADRVVPVGQALDFGEVWDGHDLLEEFTRHTVVRTS